MVRIGGMGRTIWLSIIGAAALCLAGVILAGPGLPAAGVAVPAAAAVGPAAQDQVTPQPCDARPAACQSGAQVQGECSETGAAGGASPEKGRRGYCRCSCGYPCTSSADCGGASCDPFITCC